jgi:hypothetical protein
VIENDGLIGIILDDPPVGSVDDIQSDLRAGTGQG